MNKKEKEQWLYEAYKYTSNFDFSRLDKYEEANDDICIDDIILDYTMLYEFHREEIERLNNIMNEFEDWLIRNKRTCKRYNDEIGIEIINIISNKLNELKGSNK